MKKEWKENKTIRMMAVITVIIVGFIFWITLQFMRVRSENLSLEREIEALKTTYSIRVMYGTVSNTSINGATYIVDQTNNVWAVVDDSLVNGQKVLLSINNNGTEGVTDDEIVSVTIVY